jgi:hypothetical protein
MTISFRNIQQMVSNIPLIKVHIFHIICWSVDLNNTTTVTPQEMRYPEKKLTIKISYTSKFLTATVHSLSGYAALPKWYFELTTRRCTFQFVHRPISELWDTTIFIGPMESLCEKFSGSS